LKTRHKVALIGMGRMGRNHFRVLSDAPNIELVAVVDPAIHQPHIGGAIPAGIKKLSQLQELAQLHFDALVVATPTQTHFQVVQELIPFKRPILVEKPICSSEAEGLELQRQAEQAGTVLVVGHVERHNPAIKKLQEVVASGIVGTPIHCSVTRVGGYPDNVQEGNNVLLDLAVHDLDVLQMMFGAFEFQSSIAHSTVQDGIFDTAQIVGVCARGVSADIHVNWITPTKIRMIRLTGTLGVCFADYMLQTCSMMGGNLLKKGPAPYYSYQELLELYRGSDRIEFGVTREEPLRAQVAQFVRAIEGLPHSLCSAAEASRVVRLAEQSLREARKLVYARMPVNSDPQQAVRVVVTA
jgi:UDP-N-acetylglucosamine 3-dehydrogenase